MCLRNRGIDRKRIARARVRFVAQHHEMGKNDLPSKCCWLMELSPACLVLLSLFLAAKFVRSMGLRCFSVLCRRFWRERIFRSRYVPSLLCVVRRKEPGDYLAGSGGGYKESRAWVGVRRVPFFRAFCARTCLKGYGILLCTRSRNLAGMAVCETCFDPFWF